MSRTLLALCLLLAAGARAGAPKLPLAEFESQLLRARARSAAPSVVVATVHKGKAPRYFSLGQADVMADLSATPEISYMYFSITKLFTAMAVMQMVEEGLIRLDQPVAELLPEFNYRNPWATQVTVAHLLSHTAGLPKPFFTEFYSSIHLAGEPAPPVREILWRWAPPGKSLAQEPGQAFNYSNVGYAWLGLLVEKLSGVDYKAYVKKRLLKPLRMDHSGFEYEDLSRAARGYAKSSSFSGIMGKFLSNTKFYAPSPPGMNAVQHYYVDVPAMAGMVGPVKDLARFAQACLNSGELDGARVLKSATFDRMLIAAKNSKGRFLKAGLGWWLEEVDGESTAFQQGSGGGFRSELRIYPRLGYAVAVLANQTGFDTAAVTKLVLEP